MNSSNLTTSLSPQTCIFTTHYSVRARRSEEKLIKTRLPCVQGCARAHVLHAMHVCMQLCVVRERVHRAVTGPCIDLSRASQQAKSACAGCSGVYEGRVSASTSHIVSESPCAAWRAVCAVVRLCENTRCRQHSGPRPSLSIQHRSLCPTRGCYTRMF